MDSLVVVVGEAVVVVVLSRLEGGLSTFLTLTLGLLMSVASDEKGLGLMVDIFLTTALPVPLLPLFLGEERMRGKAVGNDWTF